ncbi:hypothetical protein BXI04_20855 [Salmonella enterica subsp. enterica serovar Abony]|nr:hypothetical protein [Salmonella enterica subsp. enterica serovar Abony]
MQMPDDLIPGLLTHTGPVLIYLVNGEALRGFLLRENEFVTSWQELQEAGKLAGFPFSNVSRVQL